MRSRLAHKLKGPPVKARDDGASKQLRPCIASARSCGPTPCSTLPPILLSDDSNKHAACLLSC